MQPLGVPDGNRTIADIVFATEDARVVLAVDPTLAADEDVAAELTSIATQAGSPADLATEVEDVAQSLDWEVRVEHHGSADVLTLREP
jgi:hypothetical protein